tara:strand:+ start:773 stop:1153 length:381 start_codon:yes stop_codon:yes gene_type:complete
MNPTKTDDLTQNSAKTATPFDQIKELERREKDRVETETAAMQKEKEEVSQSIAKKEEQAAEEIKGAAKKELKEYSAAEMTTIIQASKKEAEQEAIAIESAYTGKKDSAVKTLVSLAKNPETLFQAA